MNEKEQENINDIRNISYSYKDILEAWIAGRDNLLKYGDSNGDTPDFLTWLKNRNKVKL